ncbi:MAG: VanW family protein [bacterium]|nr:VanW family protein [bacterium]
MTSHHHVIWYSIVGAVLVLLLAAVGVGAITYEHAYEGRIFPGVTIGTIDVSGLAPDAAVDRVRAVMDARLNEGLAYTLDGQTVMLETIVVASGDPDLWYPLAEVDVPSLVDVAMRIGRDGSAPSQWSHRVRGAVNGGFTVPIDVTIHAEQLMDALTANYAAALVPMEPASVRAAEAVDDAAWSFVVTEGVAGRALDADAVITMTRARIAALDPAPMALTVQNIPPPFTLAEVNAVLPELQAALARAPLTITGPDATRWEIPVGTLATLLALDDAGRPTLDRDALMAWITTTITPTVERAPRDATLTFNPNTKRVTAFTPSVDGIGIDRTLFTAMVEAAVFGSRAPLIELPVARTAPTVALEATNDLGIREMLGRGATSFTGSPANRRHNIGNGTALLNGLIIAPGEEFSTVNALSPFDAANNYKAELVIKGNRTIPEFGGGLCQVSTTLFRAVLNAGLPVTARTNHAYRVSYYEPPIGMDATIYGPWPDFRFVNDTGHHIMLIARVAGDTPTYEIWGTSDGRTAHTTEPEMFNVVQPPAARLVPTTDLPPGEKKCLERAHAGADAKFTYTVTLADGTVREEEFKSHYRPWQALCLIGVTPEEMAATDAEAAATPVEPPAASTEAPR